MLNVAGGILLAVFVLWLLGYVGRIIYDLFFWFWRDGYHYHDR